MITGFITRHKKSLTKHIYKVPLVFAVFLVVLFSLIPLLIPREAGASQLTVRSLTMSTAQTGTSAPGNAAAYTFGFTIGSGSTGTLQSMKFVACTTAIDTYGLAATSGIGSCTGPTGLSFVSAAYNSAGSSGFQGATDFAVDGAPTNNCSISSKPNVMCLNRTDATAQTGSSAKVVKVTGVVNPTYSTPSAASFYVGIYTYSDNAYTTNVDSGTVAGAVVPALSVTAAVAEILKFCIGSTSVDDSSTAVGSATSCSGTTVDLGTLDPTAINYSKTNGNNLNGVAILQTNAANGSSVTYDAILDTTGTTHTGALRIIGADCTTVPGSCITSKTPQGTLTAGQQAFGMTIAGVNCGTETANGYYTCTYSGSGDQNHLVPQSGWQGKGSGATGAYCSPANCNSDNGFKWDETGASNTIAAAASNNVVADEALILKFAATPSIANTFGSYTVKADFTAIPTY